MVDDRRSLPVALALWIAASATAAAGDAPTRPVDFNREIRPILSNTCFLCHGPDAKNRKGVAKPLRLDTEAGALADLGGYAAIVRGKPEESEVVERISAEDSTQVMPPPAHGKRLSPREVGLITRWVKEGAPYAKHWAYVKPVSPETPQVRDTRWPRSPVDNFIVARLEADGLKPSPEADRETLIRRLTLDLTGLPPRPEDVERFVKDARPDAYERLVDRLLASPTYGEHWGRIWLDLARYADSAGYADDPPRTIWAYRDYVIRSFNANKPFDKFTLEQIAGDLVPNPTEEALIATAFHRNTLTNNEGGTNDEEFRNVAVVDRVNTTMAVWNGSTIACAQCHDHKYDPLTQRDYFSLFAFLNNTQDADRTDESPTLPLYSESQKAGKAALESQIAGLEAKLKAPAPEVLAGQSKWEKSLAAEPAWKAIKPAKATAKSGAKLTVLEDKSVRAESKDKTDVKTLTLPLNGRRLTALRLEALPDDALPNKGPGYGGGNFVVSRVLATVNRPGSSRPTGRYVRVELPGKGKFLSLAEVQVFRGAENVATKGAAKQSSTAFDGPAALAIDGKTDGRYAEAKSTTHTDISDDPWWEVDLKSTGTVDRLAIWNRTDNGLHTRLSGFRVILLDEARKVVWTTEVATPPNPKAELAVSGVRPIVFDAAYADYSQPGFEAASVLDNKNPKRRGWAVAGEIGKPHALTLVPMSPVDVEPGSTLTVTIEQVSDFENHTLGRFRLAASDDDRASAFARTPASILTILKKTSSSRTDRTALTGYYLSAVAPELKETRDRIAGLKGQLAAMKPETTVPVFRELSEKERRKTRIQLRGNYNDLGDEVTEGVPTAILPLPSDAPRNRLTLARWLVSPENPLTARVIANRYWEQIFGTGLVSTSEEFGAQGEQPSHPELLDWLATELVRDGWDLKRYLRLLVTSAAYRQTSKVTPDILHRDPDNRLLARGPRFRLPAETIRDQALAVSGLLSPKMYGPPVKPPQPSLGLTAAFGGSTDWQTSPGEDRYRRGVYTTWRRSSPYPSMATFDAPNREVCTLKRTRTNTPLQALVTLNDPVYIEAAQALARRIAAAGPTTADKVRHGFRLCLSRSPNEGELGRLATLYEASLASFKKERDKAAKLATEPLGPAPKGTDVAELAAWTVVSNVLLNLDEMLMKR
jgi:mono/diheme cytochrome c family protein